METTDQKTLRGGEFLIKQTDPEAIFIPEEWTEEHRMIAQTCEDFLQTEIYPNLDRIDHMEEGLMQKCLEKAGELGLLGVTIPEEYQGLGLDFKSGMLAAECLGAGHSFSVAYGAHTGIGTLPILYYGTEEQRKKYLPKLATGEWKACYCLTEPSSGSDANSGKSRAKLTDDGKHYSINGQKMWITNSGFADTFIVFAKIDDDKNLSAFIVEKGNPGIQLNPEEKKMGIKGSSTRQVFFNDCKVPLENMLGERQQGFKIALNILNIGRIKLAGAVLGADKATITQAVRYANQREQFGRPISKYGAIKHKLAEMATQTFALESAAYRICQNIQDTISQLKADGMDPYQAYLKGIEEYAAECAMMKVYGSEVLDYICDEAVQIHGGMGYSAETIVERAYRDARINRIFEGTNEINRMLTVDMLLKKALKGDLDLTTPAMQVVSELTSIPESPDLSQPFATELQLVENFKKVVLLVAGAAAQKLSQSLAKEQEILMNIADLAIQTYVAESTLLRSIKISRNSGEQAAALPLNMSRIVLAEAADTIHKAAKNAINGFVTGDELRMMLMGIKRFTKYENVNTIALRREIAQRIIDENKYPF